MSGKCRSATTDFLGGPWDGRPAIYCAEHTPVGFCQLIDEGGAYVLAQMPDGRHRWLYTVKVPGDDNGYTRGGAGE